MKKITAFFIALGLFVLTLVLVSAIMSKAIHDNQTIQYSTRNNYFFSSENIGLTLDGHDYLMMGSSELTSEYDTEFHPSKLLNNQDHSPVMIGQGNTQSLFHAIALGSVEDQLASRQVIFILSPQWFVEKGVEPLAFATNFSELEYGAFLKNEHLSVELKEDVAQRVEQLLTVSPNQYKHAQSFRTAYLDENKYAQGINGLYEGFLKLQWKIKLALYNRNYLVNDIYQGALPVSDFSAKMAAAEQQSAGSTTTNPFYVDDSYYNTYVKDLLSERKNSMATDSYSQSPEYDDFKLFLRVCKETGIKPLLVSMPVNGFWYDYCGFSKDRRAEYYQNIQSIAVEFGFELADFSGYEYEPYFLKDVMHVGKKGWVIIGEAMADYLRAQ